MKIGLKEIVLAGSLLLGASKVSGQHFYSETKDPWNYNAKISVPIDLNNDGVQDSFSAVDSAGLKGYDYRLVAEIKDKEGNVVESTEVAKAPKGMVFDMSLENGKIVYLVNKGVHSENNFQSHRLGIRSRENLYERVELSLNGKVSHSVTGISTNNPYTEALRFD